MVALLACAGAAIFYFGFGATASTRGGYLTLAVTIGYSAFLFSFASAILLVILGRTTPRTASDATGFTLWPDWRATVLIMTGTIAALPSMLIFVVAAPFGVIEFADTRALRTVWVAVTAVAFCTVVGGLITAWRRGGMGHLKLTPAMIENADAISEKVFEWDDVVDVAAHAESRRATRAVVLRLRDGSEEVIAMADYYVPGGAGLYWLVRHYWKHPEDRDELVDGRAPQRLQKGNFDLG
ncbi:hypothetical protein [Mycobacterium sp. NAZ190054]|uniref:hypothetical protein n=1 Tax=Mycobacterium sp. NAZ190054 TaxID=1747766 RepID=UPI001E3DCEF4|nr:hypothetical protein [Mycobacterium sp. NAZ190054]